jgi:hypothetical protein
MLSGRYAVWMDQAGHVLVDRDPVTFGLVIDFLRQGCKKPILKTEKQRILFEEELEYWSI